MLKYRKVIFSHHLNLLEIALPFISEDSLSFVLFVGLNKGRKDGRIIFKLKAWGC